LFSQEIILFYGILHPLVGGIFGGFEVNFEVMLRIFGKFEVLF
jgi:hypothetical protein